MFISHAGSVKALDGLAVSRGTLDPKRNVSAFFIQPEARAPENYLQPELFRK
jgi:hypothetical protein